jgi:hypothetical protein
MQAQVGCLPHSSGSLFVVQEWMGHMPSREVLCMFQGGFLFHPGVLCGFTSANLVPEAVLSRTPTGHLCLGADLLHAVLVLKVSSLSAWLRELVLGSGAGATRGLNLQKFLHILCCFTPFWFGQCSASHCLWGVECVFPGPLVSIFLQVCGSYRV